MIRSNSNLTMSVAALLAESAVRHRELKAITVNGQSTSYGQLWDETRAYAGALREAGIEAEDRVAVLIPNVTDFARVYYAILSLGAIVVPVHALLKKQEIAYVLDDASAKMLVCAAPLLGEGAAGAELAGVQLLSVLAPEELKTDRLEDRAAKASPITTYVPQHPENIATILYTSGTTGTPKGALGTHLALVEQTSTMLLDTIDMRVGDKEHFRWAAAYSSHLRANRGAQHRDTCGCRDRAVAKIHREGRPRSGARRKYRHLFRCADDVCGAARGRKDADR